MRIVRGLPSVPSERRPSAVALGIFDGVHLGHRAILGAAVAHARATGWTALACTFEPHPFEVLQPDRAPQLITTLDERLELVAACGVDGTVVLDFTRELAAVEPEAFVKDVLVDRLAARQVVVGFNHRFGRGARGDADLLRDLGGRLGFSVDVVEPLMVDGAPVSSTAIRAALGRGDLEAAARMLGRPYTLPGKVVAGAGRGRTLRSEEHTSELQSRLHLVCRLLLEKKKNIPRSSRPHPAPIAPRLAEAPSPARDSRH